MALNLSQIAASARRGSAMKGFPSSVVIHSGRSAVGDPSQDIGRNPRPVGSQRPSMSPCWNTSGLPATSSPQMSSPTME